MKLWLLALFPLVGCTSELEDVPAAPKVDFRAGELSNGQRRALSSGQQLVPGAVVAIDASWYGTCYERDITRDEDIPMRCDFQAFQLSTSCAGSACPAPAMVSSEDSEAQLLVSPTGLGEITLLASMVHQETRETPTAERRVSVVAPESFELRGFDPESPWIPRALDTVRPQRPLLRVDAVLRGADGVGFFPSSALTVNGQAVTMEAQHSIVDLRMLFPAAVEPNGDLRAGSYTLELSLAGVTMSRSLEVRP
jgi:hypothetical protein